MGYRRFDWARPGKGRIGLVREDCGGLLNQVIRVFKAEKTFNGDVK